MHDPFVGTCKATGKRQYASWEDAEYVLRKVRSRRLRGSRGGNRRSHQMRDRVEYDAFECERCGYLHLTSAQGRAIYEQILAYHGESDNGYPHSPA